MPRKINVMEVRVKKRRPKDHKTKKGTRTIPQSICVQKGCRFYGKPAEQGVCYHALDPKTSAYISNVIKQGYEFLKEMKSLRKKNKQNTDKKWIQALEGHIVSTWANSIFGLDELIYLRAENARLRAQVGGKR